MSTGFEHRVHLDMRILIADDKKDMVSVLKAMLKRDHYAVDAVYDGRSALEYALAGDYDCLVLDIMMPALDGLEVVSALRRSGNTVPVLLLTAKGDTEDRIAGLDVGADDYLAKPFSMGELLARVRACARRSAAFVPVVLTAGDLELVRTTFTLSCVGSASAPIRLPNKEYLIMEQPMRAKGQFITPDRMREHAWGYDEYVEINVIWTHIYKLGKALEDLGSRCVIHSGRGRGYVLEEEKDRRG